MSDGITPGKPIRIYQSPGAFSDFSTEDVVSRKLNSFSGWKCGAGVENLCINFDGDVQSASCGILDSEGKTGKYGNVFESFELPKDWITCPQKFCSCGADLFIPKVKNDESYSLLKLKNGEAADLSARREKLESPAALERTFGTKYKQIFWELGRRCNYDCSYCHTYVHNNYEEHKSYDKLLFALKKLEEQFAGKDKISFAISGGEPTTNPAYMDFVKHLTSRGHRVSTHSNGSRLPDYYVDLINHSDLNISVHFEFYHRAKMLEVITAVAREIHLRKAALQNTGHLEVMLMILPGNLDLAASFEKELWEIPHFSDVATLTRMPIRGHESIENKEKLTGDVLLPQYAETELKKFGNHSKEVFVKTESLNLLDLSRFDKLDEIPDLDSRKESFRKILSGVKN